VTDGAANNGRMRRLAERRARAAETLRVITMEASLEQQTLAQRLMNANTECQGRMGMAATMT